jgi:hypothetical protein
MLDELAQPLIELQRAGVVVLFRPFHEQNGNWCEAIAQLALGLLRQP